MATTGLGVGLAEAYVMRSLHKQKMKKMEEQPQEANKSDENKTPGPAPAAPGCFSFWVSKKTRSAKVSSHNSAEKPL
ncbi:hypothetical protein V6N13_143415 [Hibiscus sabdariffa]|uniref:Uncharacterized protein n=1 Tax=Hibiscus sabdariffa TaxID=183260 RepID=A0ABR2FH96_9ROSI